MKPYKDTFLNASTRVRRFERDVSTNELVWHRDRTDRVVKILEGNGWQLQIDNGLPKKLEEGKEYYIPANNYHRLVKGKTALVVQIKEAEMKITRRQLRKIIKEQMINEKKGDFPTEEDLREAAAGFLYGMAKIEPLKVAASDLAEIPYDKTGQAIEYLCGALSSYDGFGEYKSLVNKACTMLGRTATVSTLPLKAVGKILRKIPGEMLMQAAAAGFPTTYAGRAAKKEIEMAKEDRMLSVAAKRKRLGIKEAKITKKTLRRIVREVVEEEEINPYGTGNYSYHDEDETEELIGHT